PPSKSAIALGVTLGPVSVTKHRTRSKIPDSVINDRTWSQAPDSVSGPDSVIQDRTWLCGRGENKSASRTCWQKGGLTAPMAHSVTRGGLGTKGELGCCAKSMDHTR